MKCYLIRHGRTQANIDRRYSGGRTDDPLTEAGREALCEVTVRESAALLFTSPMTRARQTAEILFPARDGIVLGEFREMDFGLFDGCTNDELSGDPAYQAWIDSNGRARFPEGEDMEEFRARSMGALQKAVRVCREQKAEALYVVAHGGTIMAVMSTLTGEPYYDFLVHNGEGYQIELEETDAGDVVAAGAYDRFCGGVRTGSADR